MQRAHPAQYWTDAQAGWHGCLIAPTQKLVEIMGTAGDSAEETIGTVSQTFAWRGIHAIQHDPTFYAARHSQHVLAWRRDGRSWLRKGAQRALQSKGVCGKRTPRKLAVKLCICTTPRHENLEARSGQRPLEGLAA
ncbi:hypothetical protein MIND_00410400 [Mycena indigotica]|uniref:Uncharacterized protein n=1 Tax=Mycena indigotica TaxID=2126181 RepID=A0A8H6SVL7_9AGAR|nr:uncharacterized protein MIND_00410400 [Mycena indigotica]KAF7306199.1 hypothetical protein MIND_00410400 [Mycena indigotica]